MYNVLAYDLISLSGELQKAAQALHSIWDDQQYSYFIDNYVNPVESELLSGINQIEILLAQFNSLTTQIEALENS